MSIITAWFAPISSARGPGPRNSLHLEAGLCPYGNHKDTSDSLPSRVTFLSVFSPY